MNLDKKLRKALLNYLSDHIKGEVYFDDHGSGIFEKNSTKIEDVIRKMIREEINKAK